MAEKKRVPFTIEQKIQIFERREQRPEESFATIAKFFTEKWGRKIDRCMVRKCHKQFKDQEKKGAEFNAADMTRSRVVPAIVRKFETELYRTINDRLVQSPMNFETVKVLAIRLQRSDDFKDDRNIQGMKFSINWWVAFQKRHGIKYSRKFFAKM